MSLALALSGSRSGALCLLFAAFATVQVLAHREGGRRRRVAIAYVVGVVATTLVWLGPATLAQAYDRPWEEWPDIGGRVGVWQDAISVAAAFPLAGTGLNTYGSAMLFYQRHDLFYHYTAAHNDYLQVAADGGLLVGIPVAWALVTLVRTIRRRFHDDVAAGRAGIENYWVRVGAVTGLAAIGLQEMFDFSLQLPGNAVMFAVLCAIAIHRAPEAGRALRPART
jgi:O-antigen ligase